jgi:hypothetical protein
MPKQQKSHFIIQEYSKEYAMVNGIPVRDNEYNKISDEKGSIIMGHQGSQPIFMRELFLKKKTRKNKTKK